MKRITKIKIALDIAMLIVLALMYSKMAINLTFHEIGGLAVIGAFVIHKALNFRWIAGVSRKLFSKKTTARTRVAYAVDALLLVCFLIIGVSGVFISKKVFHFEMKGMAFKTLHYTTSAIALALVGVHLGLHAVYLGGVFRKIAGKPGRALRGIGIALLVVTIAFGVWNIATTNFASWLAMPFSSGDMQRGGRMPMRTGADDAAGAQEEQERDSEVENGELLSDVSPDEANPSDMSLPMKERGNEKVSPLKALLVFAQYFSIAMVFATLTWAVEKWIRSRKRELAA